MKPTEKLLPMAMRFRGSGHYRSPAEFIDERIERIPECGCWIWLGKVDAKGYGLITTPADSWRAHRFSYETFLGKIPAGLVIDHLCRTPICVNPAHMEPVTHEENTRRGALLREPKTHCHQNHPFDELNTYIWNGDGARHCRECARQTAAAFRARKIAANPPRGESMSVTAINARKTHCIRGHELNEENVYLTPVGGRTCKPCRRLGDLARYEKKLAEMK